jgi:hypothetical protein
LERHGERFTRKLFTPAEIAHRAVSLRIALNAMRHDLRPRKRRSRLWEPVGGKASDGSTWKWFTSRAAKPNWC